MPDAQQAQLKRKKDSMSLFDKQSYSDPMGVIKALTDEWLNGTADDYPDVPAAGWPTGDQLEIHFDTVLPATEQELIEVALKDHFDNKDRKCLLPIKNIEFPVEEGVTCVRVVGDRNRAHEMHNLPGAFESPDFVLRSRT